MAGFNHKILQTDREMFHLGAKARAMGLEPLFEQLETGRSPGQVILDRWEGEWGGSFGRLIDYARY